jgi:hypothetical protein
VSFRRGFFSETRPAPVLLAQVLPDRTPLYRTGCSGSVTQERKEEKMKMLKKKEEKEKEKKKEK